MFWEKNRFAHFKLGYLYAKLVDAQVLVFFFPSQKKSSVFKEKRLNGFLPCRSFEEDINFLNFVLVSESV